jgi:CelD/BcsL family acetyltransferase involved in cellulose biosynthesis
MHVICVRDRTGSLLALAPFFERRERRSVLGRSRTLQLIGDGSGDSDYLDVIAAGGFEAAALDAIWGYLQSERRAWDLLQLTGIPDSSPTVRWLERLGESEGLVARREAVACALSNLPGSWNEYLELLKPRFRTKVRSLLKKVDEGSGFRFRSVETEDDLAQALATLFELHGRRWRVKGRKGVFLLDGKERFYRSFAPRFLRRGWLAFDLLELHGRVVACQLSFRYAGTQFLLQEGFDPELGPDSVGIALRALVFRKAIADGIRRYDFLAGVGRHKMQWCASVKNCVNVSIGRKTIPNVIRLRGPLYLDKLKQQAKAVLPRRLLEIRRRMAESRIG